MTRYEQADSYPYNSWTYPQGFMLWGMEALYRYTGNKKYYDYIMDFVNKHVDEDGNIERFTGISLDDILTGSIIVWAYKETGLSRYKIACDNIRRVFDTYPRNPDGGFWHGKELPHEMWVDGVFMGQMFLINYGYYIGDSDYCYNEAANQLAIIYQRCCKNHTGLIIHAYSDDKKAEWADQQTGLSPEVWSEGLGWYALIMARVMELFPVEHPRRETLVKQYMELLYSLKEYQDKNNGLWYQVVDKPECADNWNDSSGSAMFLYAIQKAIDLGLAEQEEFSQTAEKAYQGLITKMKTNQEGLVDIYDACEGLCVQKSYDVYVHYDRKINAQEAVAAYLWAMSIYEFRNV